MGDRRDNRNAQMIKDINPNGDSYPGGLRNLIAWLFFWAIGKWRKTWVTDGTIGNAQMIKDINLMEMVIQ